jgi:hypothetical protein
LRRTKKTFRPLKPRLASSATLDDRPPGRTRQLSLSFTSGYPAGENTLNLPVMGTEEAFATRALNQTCTGFLVQEYFYQDELQSDANVIFLSLGTGHTLRFLFDAGVFFWKEASAVAAQSDALYQYHLVEPKFADRLRGRRIMAVNFSVPSESARELEIAFEGGVRVQLRDERRRSSLRCQSTLRGQP